MQQPQFVGSCAVWPLEEGQTPPLVLASPGARRSQRQGDVCSKLSWPRGRALKPLDTLYWSTTVWHAYLKLLAWS